MMLPGAVETTVKLQDLKGASASGYYFLVTDKAPGPGEYLYAVNGEFGVGDLLVHVTILLRDKNDANLAVALKALEAMEQKKE